MAEDVPTSSTDDKEEFQEAYTKYGLVGIKQLLEKKMEEWKDVPLKIGVTGRSGVGKSSFINTFRGLTAEDFGAAEVGVTETTETVKKFHHPKNKKLILYDLPGVGTPTFPRAIYLTDEHVAFNKYHFFLILTADRFMDDDLWLAKKIRKSHREFLFIRTKVDSAIEDDKTSKPEKHRSDPNAVTKLISEMRDNCEINLKNIFSGGKGRQRVYLIDNYKRRNPLYDFDILTKHIMEDFPSIKQDALILSISAMTPNIIEAKKEVLRGRIWKKSVLSALGTAVPFPGVSLIIDAGIVLDEVIFYRQQLGLEDDELRNLAKSFGKSWDVFKKAIHLRCLDIQYTKEGIKKLFSSLEIKESLGFEKVVSVIPVIGGIVGGALSYGSTKHALARILDMMVNDAKSLDKYITEQKLSS